MCCVCMWCIYTIMYICEVCIEHLFCIIGVTFTLSCYIFVLILSNTIREYRRQTLAAMGADLNEELNFMDTFAEENPKNYQIWFHRRVIVERLGDPSRELEFTQAVFEVDGKNYHAWSHRYAKDLYIICIIVLV